MDVGSFASLEYAHRRVFGVEAYARIPYLHHNIECQRVGLQASRLYPIDPPFRGVVVHHSVCIHYVPPADNARSQEKVMTPPHSRLKLYHQRYRQVQGTHAAISVCNACGSIVDTRYGVFYKQVFVLLYVIAAPV